MWLEFRACCSITRGALRVHLRRKGSVIMTAVSYLIFITVQYQIFSAVFDSNPAPSIHGFCREDLLTYAGLSILLGLISLSHVDVQMNELVREGDIISALLHPLDLQCLFASHAVGALLWRGFFVSPFVVLALIQLPGFSAPAGFPQLAACAALTLMGFFVLVSFNFIVGLLAFYLHSIDGIIAAKHVLLLLLSGLLVPIDFFPAHIRHIIELLPFRTFVYTPVLSWLGKISLREAFLTLLLQALWLGCFVLAGRLILKNARRHLTVAGG